MADNDNDNEYLASTTAQNGDGAQADEISALNAQIADLKEKHLRALADAENTRRRTERERLEASQYAVTRFARDMLVVRDNLRRALDHVPADARAQADPAIKAVLDGIEATERELESTLDRHGVRAIDASDGKFDPNLHQAIAEVPAEGKPVGTVVNVVQTGYRIADRLLRPAMVTIARATSEDQNPKEQQQPEQR
ncbi:MAG TPA: nucleotide exchange factor GrpE [Rhizomicrobium sp.]|jgi:molecular chaperone GrpE